MLALVLVKALCLNVENRGRVKQLAADVEALHRKNLLAQALDGGKLAEHGVIIGVIFEHAHFFVVVLKILAGILLHKGGKLRVRAAEPPPCGNSVGYAAEAFRKSLIHGGENAGFHDLDMVSRNAVYAVAAVNAEVRHIYLIAADNRHALNILGGKAPPAEIFPLAAVKLLHNGENSGQERTEHGQIPVLKRLRQNSVVRIAEKTAAKLLGVFPSEAAFVKQHPHKLRNGKGGVGVVDVNGGLLRQVFQGAVFGKVAANYVLNGGAAEEILLLEAKQLALRMTVIGVENGAYGASHSRFAESFGIKSPVKQIHIRQGRFRPPKPELRHIFRTEAGNKYIIGNGLDGFAVFHHHMVEAVVPGFLDFSAEGYLNRLFRLFGKPNLSAGKPIIGLFGLPALAKHLAENAVFVTDGIAHGGLADGGKSVKEAGGKPPQASVAKTCVRLLLVDFFRGNSK